MEVLGWLFWIVLFVAGIGGGILAVVHLTTRVHAPIWAVVLFCIAVVVLPIFAVAASWLVYGIVRLARGGSVRQADLVDDAASRTRSPAGSDCSLPSPV